VRKTGVFNITILTQDHRLINYDKIEIVNYALQDNKYNVYATTPNNVVYLLAAYNTEDEAKNALIKIASFKDEGSKLFVKL